MSWFEKGNKFWLYLKNLEIVISTKIRYLHLISTKKLWKILEKISIFNLISFNLFNFLLSFCSCVCQTFFLCLNICLCFVVMKKMMMMMSIIRTNVKRSRIYTLTLNKKYWERKFKKLQFLFRSCFLSLSLFFLLLAMNNLFKNEKESLKN